MARLKNALRKHYIAPWKSETPDTKPSDKEYLPLAKYIVTVSDESDEETDDEGFYDGDGTPEETVISVAAGYSFEGYHDITDAAQKLIRDMKYKIGEDRRVWFKVVSSDGQTQWEAIANVSGIKTGDGDATEFEAFECTIKWISLPKETKVSDVVPGV
ncbi:phage tail tube protein [Eremococcus coleocola]|uniref:phage tail tube protein n=1 Tax=Eremococcus coleocola TaxID=88132 RepID=UPI0004291EED|nr:hypothetical protein [Eremococcus coleocola]